MSPIFGHLLPGSNLAVGDHSPKHLVWFWTLVSKPDQSSECPHHFSVLLLALADYLTTILQQPIQNKVLTLEHSAGGVLTSVSSLDQIWVGTPDPVRKATTAILPFEPLLHKPLNQFVQIRYGGTIDCTRLPARTSMSGSKAKHRQN
ncbi:hypothetical protein Mapa_015493 [Marchantia paleacea]|nr:hypothetical protein Mapa_015493 [Marchantia paleacea]